MTYSDLYNALNADFDLSDQNEIERAVAQLTNEEYLTYIGADYNEDYEVINRMFISFEGEYSEE